MTVLKKTQATVQSGENFDFLLKLLYNNYLNKTGKVVLVLGAGASSWSGLQSWVGMKRIILETACNAFKEKELFIKEVWNKLSAKIGLLPKHLSGDALWDAFLKIYLARDSPVTIEDISSIAGRLQFLETDIRKLLKEEYGSESNDKYNIGYPPQLGYELISHMLKHRIIDGIITFNFDEALDTALINELEEENFIRIISDKQIISDDIKMKPCLFKLHGSVSSLDSLKFTEEATSVMSGEIIGMLDSVYFDEETPEDQRQVDFISMGYGFQDVDFVNWIEARSENIASLSVFKWSAESIDTLNKIKEKDIKVRYIANQELSENYSLGIDQSIWALCDALERDFIENGIPYVPLSRHLILAQIFGPDYGLEDTSKVLRYDPLHRHTPYHRFYVEFYLYLVKTRGMYNFYSLSNNPRIHRYFQHFKKMPNHDTNFKRIIDACEIKQAADLKETFYSKFSTDELLEKFNEIGLFIAGNQVHVPYFDRKKKKIIVDKEMLARDFWKIHLEAILKGPEVEVLPGIDPHSEWLFKDPQPLNTYYELNQSTKEIIKEEWTHLLLIAETGEWMFNKKEYLDLLHTIKKDRDHEKNILLIKASPISHWKARKDIDAKIERNRKKLQKADKKESNKKVLSSISDLVWHEHNRHMTLAININENTLPEVFKGGIFFERRLKLSRISPVHVKNEDCLALFSVFCSYAARIYSKAEPPSDRSLLNCTKALIEKLRDKFGGTDEIEDWSDLFK